MLQSAIKITQLLPVPCVLDCMYVMGVIVENKQAVQTAKLELKKSKRKDYYKILGVDKSVTDDQLKKAYRKRAMLHHPGKRR